MDRSNLSLKWLEVFQAVARSGSVREAAKRLDISISTVSHHLTCLERAVGRPLVDHHKRPMALTPEGASLLQRVDESLWLLRKGVSEVWSDDPGTLVRRLKIASIEEFDARVMPGLATQVSQTLRACDLSFLSRPSHDILTLLQSEEIDCGIASASEFTATRLIETPLLRDPYVLVVPRARPEDARAHLEGASGLAFLRYSKQQLIGRRVEAQLRRLRLDIPSRLEFESTSTIMSLIAKGRAWTITTALNYACADRFHADTQAMAFPDAGFVRQISLFRREDLPDALFKVIETSLRPLVQSLMIDPIVRQEQWLGGEFRLTGPEAITGLATGA